MSRTASPSSGRPYGLARVCRAWRVPRATLYRHRQPARTEPPRRRGPVGPMPDADLVAAIRAVLSASPFLGRPPQALGSAADCWPPDLEAARAAADEGP